jgi:uncharacterized membrane protein
VTVFGVWAFPAADRAGEALRVVERLQVTGRLAVDDAALVEWERGRPRPSAYQVGTAAGTAALSGAFWGLLFGIALLLPLVGEQAAGLPRLGLPDEVVARIRARVTPGTSALFLLGPHVERAALGGDPLVAALDPAQDAALRRAFGADDL